jgi:hypothetical protein
MVSGKKDPKKENSPKCKVNTLASYISFGPLHLSLLHNIHLNAHFELIFYFEIIHANCQTHSLRSSSSLTLYKIIPLKIYFKVKKLDIKNFKPPL